MSWPENVSSAIDHVAMAVSPRWHAARQRDQARAKLFGQASRFGYSPLGNKRLHTKRSGLSGAGDTQLTESALSGLRDIARDMGRNNPIVDGLLQTEADDVVGTRTMVQSRSSNRRWNQDTEGLFREEMVERPCDVTGRFNLPKIVYTAYQSYRRDGDSFLLLTDRGLEAFEGDQVGTPWGAPTGKTFTVTNGVATSKQTGRVIGYYLGRPNQWGYIDSTDWRHYPADQVHHCFNPKRFSYTRGEPALTSAVETIDKVTRYIDAELVAAHVNACLSIFVVRKDELGIPAAYTEGDSSGGQTDEGSTLQHVEPGEIHHFTQGESITAVTPSRPPTAFDPFVLRALMLIGRPLCLPLMLVTLDFSGATYMNARIAYQAAQKNFRREQDQVIKPMVSRIWRWWLAQKIAAGQIKDRRDAFAHEVICQRWAYVDPYREAQADKIELQNRTTSRTQVCARKGLDVRDLDEERGRDRQSETDAGEPNADGATQEAL